MASTPSSARNTVCPRLLSQVPINLRMDVSSSTTRMESGLGGGRSDMGRNGFGDDADCWDEPMRAEGGPRWLARMTNDEPTRIIRPLVEALRARARGRYPR